MDPAILFAVAMLGAAGLGAYTLRVRYLARLPLEVSRFAIRQRRGPDGVLLFRARLGRGRPARRPSATIRVSGGGVDDECFDVEGPAQHVVGPWTFRVPMGERRWSSELTVHADVRVQEGDREWSAEQTWRANDIKIGSYPPLSKIVVRAVGIDRLDWQEVIAFSTDHTRGERGEGARL